MADYLVLADESGTHSAAAGTLLAGYIAPFDAWEKTGPAWDDAHRRARLKKPFHMTDFLAKDHPDYRHLSDPEREQLIHRLVAAIRARKRTGFVAAVTRQDYDRVLRPEVRKYLRDPYLFCFRLMIQAVIFWAEENLNRGDRIAMVFEHKKGFEVRARRMYGELRAIWDKRRHLASDCLFQHDYECALLSAADILANRAGSYFRRPTLPLVRHEDPILYDLLSSRRLRYDWRYCDREGLERLQRHMIADGFVRLRPKRDPRKKKAD